MHHHAALAVATLAVAAATLAAQAVATFAVQAAVADSSVADADVAVDSDLSETSCHEFVACSTAAVAVVAAVAWTWDATLVADQLALVATLVVVQLLHL